MKKGQNALFRCMVRSGDGLVFRSFCGIPVNMEVDMREKVIIFGKDT